MNAHSGLCFDSRNEILARKLNMLGRATAPSFLVGCISVGRKVRGDMTNSTYFVVTQIGGRRWFLKRRSFIRLLLEHCKAADEHQTSHQPLDLDTLGMSSDQW